MSQNKIRFYTLEETGEILTRTALRRTTKQRQVQFMSDWFHNRYTGMRDLPCIEGDYLFLWGGPYDAREELEDEFGGSVSESAIDSLSKTLNDESYEWSGVPAPYPEEEDFLEETRLYRQTPCEVMCLHLDAALQMLGIKTEFPWHAKSLAPLLYANAITCLEVYLGSLFAVEIEGKKERLIRFLQTNPEFKDRKFTLSEVLEVAENVEKTVSKHLSNVVWHQLAKVERMYQDTFGIKFPQSAKVHLMKAVAIRHHIVHRNGVDQNGHEVPVAAADVRALIADIKAFALELEEQLGRPACPLAYAPLTL